MGRVVKDCWLTSPNRHFTSDYQIVFLNKGENQNKDESVKGVCVEVGSESNTPGT